MIGLLLFASGTELTVMGQQIVQGSVPVDIAKLGLPPIGRLDSLKTLDITIGLPLQNQEALNKLLSDLYDVTSPNFHQWLTPEEFTSQFSPTEQDYQATIAFTKANGFTVTKTYSNRLLVDVVGTVRDIEKAFRLKMMTYNHPKRAGTFYAPETEPSLDLKTPVIHISGLSNYSVAVPHIKVKSLNSAMPSPANGSGSGPGNSYVSRDFRAAYTPGSSLTGSGQVVASLQFDGYTLGDITYYESHTGLPNLTPQKVLIDGASGNPSGYPTYGEIEVSLDIEMALAMAPNLSGIIVYEAPTTGDLYTHFEHVLNQMVTDNSAKQLSCSWELSPYHLDQTADNSFIQMAAQGQSFFNASGDEDAVINSTWTYNGEYVYSYFGFPSEDPNITQVGGTTLITTGPGGSYNSESVWNTNTYSSSRQAFEGSAGGVSLNYSIPSWQQGINMSNNQGSTTMRNVPDVALIADGIYERVDNQDIDDQGGTSCAAPLWAGFMALANQQGASLGHNPAGFINPLTYLVNKKGYYTSYFHDLTTGNGNNEWPGSGTKFSPTSGYDLCTGWGTPIGQALINVFAHNSPAVTIYGPTQLNQNQAGTFTATASSGAPPYIYQWWKEENGVPGAGPASQKVSPDRPPTNNWYMIGSNSPTELTSDITNFSIKCVVTDPTTQNGSDSVTSNIISVIVNGSGMAENTQSQSEAVVRDIPEENSLSQNYPNPFNPSTQIRFALTEPVHVKLIVYDMLGREVAKLADENMEAGYHSVTWNATNVSSGIYFYQLSASGFVQVRRMIVMK